MGKQVKETISTFPAFEQAKRLGRDVEKEAPPPPTPSPREFGVRLITMVSIKTRINEERGSLRS